jgi:hypothetical protein
VLATGAVGFGTLIVMVCGEEHGKVGSLTEYVVVVVGDATTEAVFVALKPVEGVHTYEFAPLAVSVT